MLVIVSNDSAEPCNQSTLASISLYVYLAYIPAGIVAATNTNKKQNPKNVREGVLVSFLERKKSIAKYGNNEIAKKVDAESLAFNVIPSTDHALIVESIILDCDCKLNATSENDVILIE